ncbi:uncharacterized protein LOC110433769 [Sorghum bicolor]|uniref:uncharacterized protein LOC110433769 n=1 Tax=Sorghum bicolor TaxID=4558 RepID=UPI000B42462C|nr:uncharacterized protein LOC110433769 [Sorghum bicolor]|eukprot:XP_021312014.1 uncharacterized protein LOC110433769 [Sorghum bicolor]
MAVGYTAEWGKQAARRSGGGRAACKQRRRSGDPAAEAARCPGGVASRAEAEQRPYGRCGAAFRCPGLRCALCRRGEPPAPVVRPPVRAPCDLWPGPARLSPSARPSSRTPKPAGVLAFVLEQGGARRPGSAELKYRSARRSTELCGNSWLFQWKIGALLHHWVTRLTLLMEKAMLDSAREKEKRLDGMQCLRRKGTKKIKNVGKHTKEERSNTYVMKLPMVVY